MVEDEVHDEVSLAVRARPGVREDTTWCGEAVRRAPFHPCGVRVPRAESALEMPRHTETQTHTHRHTLVGEHAHTTPHSIQLFQLSPVNCAATIARPRAGAPSARPAYGRQAQIEMCNQFLVDQVRKFVESIDGGIGHTLTAANHVIVR